MLDEEELRQMFKNRSDCYADTWQLVDDIVEEGDVIQAMTEDAFIDLIKEIKL